MYESMNLDGKFLAYSIKLEGIENFLKDERTRGKVTPIAYLASRGKHEAVNFLLELSCNVNYALQGYDLGGYLSSEESVSEILNSISDSDHRQEIAKKIQEVVTFDVDALMPTNTNLVFN